MLLELYAYNFGLLYILFVVVCDFVMGSLIVVKGWIITHKPIFYTLFYSWSVYVFVVCRFQVCTALEYSLCFNFLLGNSLGQPAELKHKIKDNNGRIFWDCSGMQIKKFTSSTPILHRIGKFLILCRKFQFIVKLINSKKWNARLKVEYHVHKWHYYG